MSKRTKITLTVAAVSVLTLVCLIGTMVYVALLPRFVGDQETIILGQSRFVPGSQAAIRVAVRDTRDASPVSGATIRVAMRPQSGGQAVTLYEGTTDARGTAEVSFTVPDTDVPAQELIVETRSELGRDKLERAVTVKRDYKLLLTSDKPLYQPGQTIHLRALALSAFDLRPAADGEVEFVVADAKGNKVFRKTVATSEYGIAATDFVLADEVNTGRYKITAQMEKTASERTVTVQHYVLPKFKLVVETDRDFYRPGDRVSGQLSAQYFFGKPVSEGQVTIEGYTFDVEREQAVAIQGVTDAEGRFQFEFTLPDYLVASGLEGEIGQFIVEVAVKDQAEHTERTAVSLPVAQESIVIQAVPESGELKPGVENIVYVATTYPNGAPAACRVTVDAEGRRFTLTTGEYGLGELRFTPDRPYAQLRLTARDEMGHRGTLEKYLEGRWENGYVLLRPERAAYRVGQTMRLDVFTSAPVGSAYLDIVREGQTISTRSLDVRDGQASADVDLTPDMFGTLELHAYKIMGGGNIVRDTRLVIVDAANDLRLAISSDRDTHLPGSTAAIRFDVTDAGGQPVPATLGVSVVDEALFALAEQDPGFAKIYFLLEKELQQPKYQIKGFTWGQVMKTPPEEPALRQAQDTSAKAALALAAERSFSLTGNSHRDKEQQVRERQERYFRGVAWGVFPFTLLVPLAIGVLALLALRRDKVALLTLMVSFVLALGSICFLAVLPAPSYYEGPLEKLGWLIEELGTLLICVGPVVGLGGLVGLVVLAVRAIRQPDSYLGWKLLLLIAYVVLLPLLVIAGVAGDWNPDEWLAIPLIIAYLMVPAAFVLRGIGFGLQRQAAPAVAGVLAGAFTFFVPLSLVMMGQTLSLPTSSLGGPQRGMAMPMAVPTMAPTMVEEKAADAGREKAAPGAGEQKEAPRLRQWFPELLYWNPQAVTDDGGHLTLDIPLADSITTWRLTALASAQDGALGSATAGIRVFQDFFVDIDLPVYFTQGDEVSVPIAVYNYLPEAQTVRLTLTQEDWFDLLDEAEKELYIAADDVEVVYFRIRVARFGTHSLTMTALGERMSDAIKRQITVYPDGKRFEASFSDRLEGPVEKTVPIPAEAINGTGQITVKIYPGVLSQVVEGLEKLLRLPHG